MARGRFLGGLLETKGKANPKEAALRAAGGALANGSQPLGVAGPWDMQKATKDGLEKVGMVFRCVDAIAQKASSIPMDLRMAVTGKSRNDAKSVDDEQLWKLLNFRANGYETSMQFRYRLSATLLLSRRGAFVEMVRDQTGKVMELHLLSPGMVEPIPDKDKFVRGYQIMRGDYVVDEVPADRVCWIKIKPHPMDPYSQLTPLMSSGIAVETDYLARIFNRNFLANDGRPGMIVTIQGNLNPEDAEEIKSRFSGGIAQAGRTSVLEADGIEVADMAVNPRDVQWSQMLDGSKEAIQLAFGVPESVMGNASGRTFDNADAERENFYVDTVVPHCDPIAMGLDPITGSTQDDVVIAYDYSGVDVLQRMAARKRTEWREEVAAGLRTIDSYFEAIGEEPFDVVGTRVLYHSSGLAIARTPEDQAGIMDYKVIGAEPGEGLEGAAAAESGALKGTRKGIAEADRQRGNTDAAAAIRGRALRLVKAMDELEVKNSPKGEGLSPDAIGKVATHPYLGLRLKTEGMLEGHLAQWDARQESVVADRLNHTRFRKGTRHWETETKDLPKTQKCKYCDAQATKRVIHSEGRAYVPACDTHLGKAKDAAANCTPGKVHDPSNIDRVDEIKSLELKALDPSYAVNVNQWTTDLLSGMGDFIHKAMVREAKNAAKELKANGLPAPAVKDLPQLLDPAYVDVLSIIKSAAGNQSGRLLKSIKQLDAEGASLKEIESKVRAMTGARAPWRKALSANVVTTAVEAARAAVYEGAGPMYQKYWQSEQDARVRHTHVKADGQKRAANKPFTVGGFKMMHPGDMTAPIQEVANCRCWTEYEPSDAFYKRANR